MPVASVMSTSLNSNDLNMPRKFLREFQKVNFENNTFESQFGSVLPWQKVLNSVYGVTYSSVNYIKLLLI